MDLKSLLLLVAFRHRIQEPDSWSGLLRFEHIVGCKVAQTDFHAALASALSSGSIHDPVELLSGALQCHWHLQLTPRGVEEVQTLVREQGMSADELIALAKRHP
jgi:hypothetical protein